MKRKTPKGTIVWHYYYYDSYGIRKRLSTGKTSENEAEAYCMSLLVNGKIQMSSSMPFSEYAKNWWSFETCDYVKMKLAEVEEGKRGLAESSVSKNLEILNLHILPSFGKIPIGDISVTHIEKWKIDNLRREKKLKNQTINNIESVLRVMLKEAYRKDVIYSNPMDKIRTFKRSKIKRSLLSTEEVNLLFDPKNWKNKIYYACNLLSAHTGTRSGEIRGLLTRYWQGDHFNCELAYSDRGKLGPTKTEDQRQIPVPPKLAEIIEQLKSPYGYIFSHNGGETPVSGNRMNDALKEALAKIGIKEKERKDRGITFHGWRHWFTTVMVSRGIIRDKIDAVSGHTSEEMEDHYTTFRPEDLKEIIEAQKDLINF